MGRVSMKAAGRGRLTARKQISNEATSEIKARARPMECPHVTAAQPFMARCWRVVVALRGPARGLQDSAA